MPDTPNPAASAVVSPNPQGVSNPPDGGAVTSIDTPPNQMQTPAPAASAAVGMGGSPAATPPVPTPVQAQLARQVKTGLGFHALMGNHVEYQQGPNGPVPVPVQNKPGQLFRSILAGAIMGMGAGPENNAGSGWGAIGAGARAAHQNFQQQQQIEAQQAQQQWQNKLRAQQEQREQQGFDTEQQVRKAQIAQANAETLRTNILTQGASFGLHQQIADADKNRISTFVDAGVKPVYENIPESQMTDIIKNSPGASTLEWRHTGVKTVLDKDRNPSYEYTLSAYDPKASAPLSPATVKQWEEDGLFKYHPEYKDIAKPGKVLTVDQFTSLDKQAQNFYNQNLAKNKNELETEHLKAQIDEARAAVRAHNATVAHEGLSTSILKQQNEKQKQEDAAWDALAKVGNDPDKLTDPHQRAILARSVQPLMQETLNSIKTAAAAVQSGDTSASSELPGLWSNLHTYQKLASLAPASSAKGQISVTFNGQTGVFPSQADADAFIKAHPGASVAGGPDPNEKVMVQRPDGSTGIMTRAEYQQAVANPTPGTSTASVGKIIGPAPAAKTPEQTLAGLNLTGGGNI